MADGRLAALPAFQPIDLLASWRSAGMAVTEAAWSPNGGYLVFIAGTSEAGSALYFAQGDGTQVRQSVPSLEGALRSMVWAPDGQTAVVVTSTHVYTLEVATGQVVDVTPTPAGTGAATPSPTAIP
jgi:Tol biopolymer transport system component